MNSHSVMSVPRSERVADQPPALTGYTHPTLGEHAYDFYRCQRCQRLVTQLEMSVGISHRGGIRICPCGALKFSPTQVTWRDYALPQVIRFARTRYTDAELRADLWAESAHDGGWCMRTWAWLRLYAAQAGLAV